MQYERAYHVARIRQQGLPLNDGNLFRVDVLRAMRWATIAKNKLTGSTIVNCWRGSGLLPPPQDGTREPTDNDDTANVVLEQIKEHLSDMYGADSPAIANFEPDPAEEQAAVHPVLNDDEIVAAVRFASATEQSTSPLSATPSTPPPPPEPVFTLKQKMDALNDVITFLSDSEHQSTVNSLGKIRTEIRKQATNTQSLITRFLNTIPTAHNDNH